MPSVKSYILWYHSKSHGKDRFFVGVGVKHHAEPGCPGHPCPAWDYEKHNATILDGDEGPKAKLFAESCGYTGLILEPIDEQPSKSVPKHEKVH